MCVPGADLVSCARCPAHMRSCRRAEGASMQGLILNAGLMAPPLMRTKDGFEMQMGALWPA